MDSLSSLGQRCQKPSYQQQGHWLARRVARPSALHCTRRLLPLGVSANGVTAAALLVGVAAAVCLGWGTLPGLGLGVALLHVWYLLDHVDGQVARFRDTACLSGVFFDYLMHYSVHACLAFGLGYACAVRTGDLRWSIAAAAWALGTVLIGLQWDCRYKAWFDSLGERSFEDPLPSAPRSLEPDPERQRWDRRLFRLLQVSVEIPSVLCTLPCLALGIWLQPRAGWLALRGYVLAMAVSTLLIAALKSWRVITRRDVDREFELWFGNGGRARNKP